MRLAVYVFAAVGFAVSVAAAAVAYALGVFSDDTHGAWERM